MTSELLNRFRRLLSQPGVTVRMVAEKTGIPYTTLIDMAKPDWSNRTFAHLERLEAALPELEAAEAEASQ